MKKIVFGYTPTGNHCRTTFYEDSLDELSSLKMFNWSKVGDHIEVLGKIKVEVPQFYDKEKLNKLVSDVSSAFPNTVVEYNNTSVHTDRVGKPH